MLTDPKHVSEQNIMATPQSLAASRRAKIVCTLGPSIDSEEKLQALVRAGMDAVRLNLSFGKLEDHLARLRLLKKVIQPNQRPVARIVDLPGRKIRLGRLEPSLVHFEPKEKLTLRKGGSELGNAREMFVDERVFHKNMARGDTLLLSDGRVELAILDFDEHHILCEVIRGGDVRERTSVHVFGSPHEDPIFDAHDKEMIKALVSEGVDFLSAPDVCDGQDLVSVKELLGQLKVDLPVIAKIERPEAFARLDSILRRCDAVMIRRGDLGAQMEMARVPLVQKEIIKKARLAGVPVIIATQMLNSMVRAPRPTRAEASDVSNAIMDGVDGVLLSAETAIGDYPIEATQMMARIIQETERTEDVERIETPRMLSSFADAAARVATEAAIQIDARIIVCFTESGRTARLVARHRPKVPILAFCPSDVVRRRLSLNWGVRSSFLDVTSDVDEMVRRVDRKLQEYGLVESKDRIVIIFGAPVGERGHTNSVRLHEIGRDGRPGSTQSIDLSADLS